jgi:hypothetical protein
MRTPPPLLTCAAILAAMLPALGGCHLVAPSCTNEDSGLFHVAGEVAANSVASYTVTSTKNSNLRMRLAWPDPEATIRMAATVTACGEHAACVMDTRTPPFGPGGSAVPQPWPPGLRELQVDGTKGKTYRIEIGGDPVRDATFTLDVNTHIACER